MRRIITSLVLLLAVTSVFAFRQMDGPLVMGDRAKPASGAIFQVESTTGGFLGPRMTQAQRDAISSPATGLLIYNLDTGQYEIWNGAAWRDIASGSGFLSKWVTGSGYAVDDIVFTVPGDKFYRANSAHTSGADFATDFGLGLWTEVSNDVNSAATPVVDNSVVRYNGTDADSIQESGVIIDDSDVVTGITQLNVDNLRLDGNTLSSTDAAGNIILDPDTTGQVNLPDLTAQRPLYLDASNNITSPAWGSLINGTANQVTVTDNGADLTLSTPQDIATTSDVSFNSVSATTSVTGATVEGTTSVDGGNLQLSGNTLSSTDAGGNIILDPDTTGQVNLPDLTVSQPAYIDASGNLVSQDLSLTADVSGILPEANGGTGLDASGVVDGQLLIGSSLDNTFDLSTLTGTANQVTVTNGNGSITLATPQDINTTSSPTFAGLTSSGDILMTGTGQLDLPTGTTAQRSGTPNTGMIRFNSDTTSFEGYNGAAWGSLGGGAGTKDIIYQQDFESDIDSADFTCGTNLTAANDTSTPLNDLKSITFTQGATPPTVGVKCAGPTVTLPLKAQTKNLVEVCFQATWDGNDNEMALNIESGGTDLVQVLIPASSTAKKHCGYFDTDSTTSVDFDIEVIAQNANAVLEIDDLEITVDPLTPTDIYASSDWEDCGMTASDFSAAFGSVTNIQDLCRRDGPNLIINVKYDAGTVTGGAAEITPRYKGSTIVIDSLLVSETSWGKHYRGTSAAANHGTVLLIAGESIVRFGPASSTGAQPLTARPADEVCATSVGCIFEAVIPVEGWSDTAQGVVVKNVESSDIGNTNTFSARIAVSGSATITTQNLSWLDSPTYVTAGEVDHNIKSGVFSVVPSCTCTSERTASSAGICTVTDVSTTGFTINTSFITGGANGDMNVHVTCKRQSTDFVKESEKVYTVPVDSLTGNTVLAAGNGSEAITASSTDIPFVESKDTANAWDGDSYTVQNNNSVIELKAVVLFGSSADRAIDLYKNNVLYKRIGERITNTGQTASYTSGQGEFAAGDSLSLRVVVNGGTLSNSSADHYLNINESYGDRGIFLGTFGQPTCYVKDVKSSGTGGGASGTVDTFTTRDLNTTEGSCSFLSLSSNTITLEAGGYDFDCQVPTYRTESAKARVYDGTNTLILSQGNYAANDSSFADQSIIHLVGNINLSTSTDVNIQHVESRGGVTSGFGIAYGLSGVDEIYTQCKITKVR